MRSMPRIPHSLRSFRFDVRRGPLAGPRVANVRRRLCEHQVLASGSGLGGELLETDNRLALEVRRRLSEHDRPRLVAFDKKNGRRAGIGGSAGSAHRHSHDVSPGRETVHCAHGCGKPSRARGAFAPLTLSRSSLAKTAVARDRARLRVLAADEGWCGREPVRRQVEARRAQVLREVPDRPHWESVGACCAAFQSRSYSERTLGSSSFESPNGRRR